MQQTDTNAIQDKARLCEKVKPLRIMQENEI